MTTRKIIGVFIASALFTGPVLSEELTIGLASEPTAIDPHFHNLGPNNAMARHVFDRLDIAKRITATQSGACRRHGNRLTI